MILADSLAKLKIARTAQLTARDQVARLHRRCSPPIAPSDSPSTPCSRRFCIFPVSAGPRCGSLTKAVTPRSRARWLSRATTSRHATTSNSTSKSLRWSIGRTPRQSKFSASMNSRCGCRPRCSASDRWSSLPRLAEVMFGATAGLFAALVLALSPLFFGFARFATLDPALAFFLTAALAAFYLAAREDSFSRPSARRWMLTCRRDARARHSRQGPGRIAAWRRDRADMARIRAPPARNRAECRWSGAALIYAAIVLPWFVLMEMRNPGFLRFFFIHEHLAALRLVERARMGPVVFHPDRDRRNLALDFFRPARMVRDAR